MISNEELSAFVDGELPPEDMQRVREAVEQDQLLAARLRRFREVDQLLGSFASGIDREPLPAGLCEQLGVDERGSPFAPSDPAAPDPALPRAGPQPGSLHAARRWAVPMTLAAGLLIAVFAGFGRREASPQQAIERLVQLGPVPATSRLGQALEHVPSGTGAVAGEAAGPLVTPLLSFVSSREGVCREFSVESPEHAARGIACRRETGWETLRVVAAARPAGTEAPYQTASGEVDAGFDAFVDALIDGEPLGAEDEQRLLSRRWALE